MLTLILKISLKGIAEIYPKSTVNAPQLLFSWLGKRDVRGCMSSCPLLGKKRHQMTFQIGSTNVEHGQQLPNQHNHKHDELHNISWQICKFFIVWLLF